MGTCTLIQQYPLIRRKTGLHLTTDSAPHLIVLMVANIFNSSSNGSHCCCTNHNGHGNKFQMSRGGPKTTPTNHGPREKQSDKEHRSQHAKTPVHRKEKSSGQGCRQNRRILKRLLKNCTRAASTSHSLQSTVKVSASITKQVTCHAANVKSTGTRE